MDTVTVSQFGPRSWRSLSAHRHRGRLKVLLASLLVLSTCTFTAPALAQVSKPPAKNPETRSPLDERVKNLENKVRDLDVKLKIVVASDLIELNCNKGGVLWIQAIEFGLAFMIGCEKIEPYLEGHRVLLSVGNPYSVTLKGLSANIRYGKDFADAFGTNPAIGISTPEDLSPGAWLTVPVIINPSKAEDLRALYVVGLAFKTVSARRLSR